AASEKRSIRSSGASVPSAGGTGLGAPDAPPARRRTATQLTIGRRSEARRDVERMESQKLRRSPSLMLRGASSRRASPNPGLSPVQPVAWAPARVSGHPENPGYAGAWNVSPFLVSVTCSFFRKRYSSSTVEKRPSNEWAQEFHSLRSSV